MSSSSNKIVLISSDGESFEIDEAVARKFQTISNMIEDDCAEKPISVANVTGKILGLAIDYYKKHVLDNDSAKAILDEKSMKELESWDEEYYKSKDEETIVKLIFAANYLNAKDLLRFICRKIAYKIKDMTPEECREMFGLEDDLTPEEKEEISKEYDWSWACQSDFL